MSTAQHACASHLIVHRPPHRCRSRRRSVRAVAMGTLTRRWRGAGTRTWLVGPPWDGWARPRWG